MLLGGVIAATLDIAYAFVFYGAYGTPPVRLLQSIASGLLGREAYAGGYPAAALGALLHYCISICAAATFFAASLRLRWLSGHPVVAGAAFGLGVFVVMNFVVVPLSAFPHRLAFPPLVLACGLLAHMFLFGLPIALCVRAGLAAAPPAPGPQRLATALPERKT